MTKYLFNERLLLFARESNKIEGIFSKVADDLMVEKLNILLDLPILTVNDVITFNSENGLRDKIGMDVRVGNYIPTRGTPSMKEYLFDILDGANNEENPYIVHKAFENTHPFMDGNGRIGRAIWLWQMVTQKNYDLYLGFLHKWYYQSLDSNRSN